jgi:glycosyltransferase involved in cell wall biosynthesis
VIIAAHNAEQTVGETLDSLLSQTHARWEGLVVDDGSGDATADIAKRFAATDHRIRGQGQSSSASRFAAAQHEECGSTLAARTRARSRHFRAFPAPGPRRAP